MSELSSFFNNLDPTNKIAFFGVLIPAFISFIGFWFTKQELNTKTRELHSKYVDLLVTKRLTAYHDLLKKIYYVGLGSHYTNGIKHKYSDAEKIKVVQQTLSDMVAWEQNSGAFFLLTQESLDWFRRLENLLHANPEYTKVAYSQYQLNKIVRARNGLRTSLSKDLQILRISENKLTGKNGILQNIFKPKYFWSK